mgnify:CR=1 FL=1
MRIVIILCLALIYASNLIADSSAYSGIKRIWAESDDFLVLHYHDWSDWREVREVLNELEGRDQYFQPVNRFSYVRLIKKNSGKIVWESPSTAFSKIWIDPTSSYIVGISNIMLNNPFQLVVFSGNGDVVLKRHITSHLAVFEENELKSFLEKYLDGHDLLAEDYFTYEGKLYVDFMRMGMPNAIPEAAWKELMERSEPDPLVPWVSESVTNWVFWYKEPDPNLQIESKGEEIYLTLDSMYGPPGSRGVVTTQKIKIQIPNKTE